MKHKVEIMCTVAPTVRQFYGSKYLFAILTMFIVNASVIKGDLLLTVLFASLSACVCMLLNAMCV